MLPCRKFYQHAFLAVILFVQSLSSKIDKSTVEEKNASWWKQEHPLRFHPFMSTAISTSEEDKQCLDDIHTLQEGVRNQSLWAGLMMDSTATYPTGVLHGSRYYLGNFDGCMAAGRMSPVGARYCLAQLTSANSSFRGSKSTKDKTWSDSSNDDFGEPDEMAITDIWMAVCVPRSCDERRVQQTIQHELQLYHPTITNVQIHPYLCTDEETAISSGPVIYWRAIIGLIVFALVATILDKRGGKLGKMRWLLCWSIPRRWNQLMAPEGRIRGIPLQSLSALRIISILIIAGTHHGFHTSKRPLLNNFIRKEVYTDLAYAPFTHAYIFLWTILFISGLFLALKSQESFFHSIFLRYLRLTPSYMVVIAFYALAFKSISTGPLWKSIIYPESEGCVNFWWADLLYLHTYFAPQPNAPGCILQCWSLNVDMQLCILGTLLLTVQKKWPKGASIFFGFAITSAMVGPFVTTLLDMRDPTWVFDESIMKNPWSASPKMRRYVSIENWAMPYLAGLCTGSFLEKSVNVGRRLSLRTVRIAVPLTTITMLLVVLSHVYWNYPGVDQRSIFAALFATAAPTIWSICLVVLTASFALGPKTWLVSILCAQSFVVLGRLGYSIYLVHYGAQIAYVGLMRAPIYASFFPMALSFFQEICSILPACLLMYLLIEAPIRELSKDLFRAKSTGTTLDGDQSNNKKMQ